MDAMVAFVAMLCKTIDLTDVRCGRHPGPAAGSIIIMQPHLSSALTKRCLQLLKALDLARGQRAKYDAQLDSWLQIEQQLLGANEFSCGAA